MKAKRFDDCLPNDTNKQGSWEIRQAGGNKPKCNIFSIILMVGNPTVAACLDSLNRKSELISEKYWVAKAKKNIARGKT
jgi:hypothetical protein